VKFKLIFILIILTETIFSSGGFDNGTSTGKGKFQIDLTWNPLNMIKYGQSYSVMGYGITDNFDFHSYVSYHNEGYRTWYAGFFHQFLNTKKLHLATALGIRRSFEDNWTHLFAPQILYTAILNDKFSIGGSFVKVNDFSKKSNYNTAIDIALSYKTKIKTKKIESVSFSIGGFHPTTWDSDVFFLPTYSIDIKFK